jgi:hypothetical protein
MMTKQEAFELVKTKADELYDAITVLAGLHTTGCVGLAEWKEDIFETLEEIEGELDDKNQDEDD